MKVLKVKIYQKHTKTNALKQSLGNTRFIWNKLLDMEKEYYKDTGKFFFYYDKENRNDMAKRILTLKQDYPFLKQTYSHTLQQIAMKLNISLKQFFKYKSTGWGFPSYRSRKRFQGILIFPDNFKFKGNKLFLPKIGYVRIKDKMTKKPEWNTITETARQVSIVEEPTGFFAIITYDGNLHPKQPNGIPIGIDVGIKTTIYTSRNEQYSLPVRQIMSIVGEIEHLQSTIDTKKEINKHRKIPYSNRITQLRRRQHKLFKRLHNIKTDFYYKTINHIFNSHEYVMVEDLDLNELKELTSDNETKDRKIHKYLQNISLSDFYRILEWKAKDYNRQLIKIDPHHTSKQCSRCGYINHELQLSDRTYKCPVCGLKLDRDWNASINILKRGLEAVQKPLSAGQVEYMREMASGVSP